MNRLHGTAWCMCLIALWVSGCATRSVAPRVTVANEYGAPISDVRVYFGDTVRFARDGMASYEVAPGVTVEGGIPSELHVQWRTEDGELMRRTVRREAPLPPSFRGRILLQIEHDGVVRPFVQGERGDGAADIPWARPESWEGAPNIPGLSGS